MITSAEIAKLTPEQLQESIEQHHEEFNGLIRLNIIPQLKHLLESLDKAHPCKEYQLAVMDAESMLSHINRLVEDGPTERMSETPLDESQQPEDDDHDFDDEDEIEFSDDETDNDEEEEE